MVHDLKIWPEFYEAILDNKKTFEIRRNDRNFAVGDRVILREFDPKNEFFTGRSFHAPINYLIKECAGLNKGYCIFSWL